MLCYGLCPAFPKGLARVPAFLVYSVGWLFWLALGVLLFTILTVILTPHLKPSLINLNRYWLGNNEKLRVQPEMLKATVRHRKY